ncbi:MAG: hypothetical protein ACP5NF_04590 [Thermoanaerobaculum sp.]
MSGAFYSNLSAERWFSLSIVGQMANIGSDVVRAARFRDRDPERAWAALSRALELFELTLRDPKNRSLCPLQELCRAKEFFVGAFLGCSEFASLDDMVRYFDFFAWAYARERERASQQGAPGPAAS